MEADVRVLRKDSGFDPGCVKTLRGIIAPGILGPMVMRRAKKRKNLSSARHYDQIRFRFYTTKTLNRHKREYFAALHSARPSSNDVLDCGPRSRATQMRRREFI